MLAQNRIDREINMILKAVGLTAESLEVREAIR